ncbi:hypothetical protein HOLleu_26653 [Holothuria leucospilota]|uniref:Uncharacterized protein n=1 Tax=Holothuria leucospilota TaxID=206669 RepID=A0A9Q1BNZ6_HOLLE|nr:hypothetical protein HOLleu_26653 [Holothuria leucospilota]
MSKKFQKEVVDISIIQPLVTSSIAVISAFKDENGPNIKDAFTQTEASGVYVKVADRQSSRMLFQRESVQYATELCSNLESRFDPESMGLLRSIEAILNPANIPTTNTGLREYGLKDLKAICDVFGKEVVTSPMPNLREAANMLPVPLPPLIDSQHTQQDFHQVKVFLRSGNFVNLQVACEKLCQLSETFPYYALPL